MDGMFDHNHDGKLSAGERMDRDYFITEMMDHSDHTPQTHSTNSSGNTKGTLLGVLFLIIGVAAFIYFPVFALIMIGLAIYFFAH